MNAYILVGLAVIGYFFVAKPIGEKVEEMLPAWNQFDQLFQTYGSQFNVPWEWLKAIAVIESDLGQDDSVAEGMANPDDIEGSKSSDGKSWGLMQVTLTTAQSLDSSATVQKLNDPEYSIGLAARYVAQLSKHFPKVDARYTEWVIKSYNQGPGNSDKERAGIISGYAGTYWSRFQAALQRVQETE